MSEIEPLPFQPGGYIPVKHLFRKLDEKLIDLLETLAPAQWALQTVAKEWRVKDVAAHLLDGNLRLLSIQRDRYFGEPMPVINSYQDLVAWLNQLNASWVQSAKRLSPAVLTSLLKLTGSAASTYYESIDLDAEAIFAVSWAGEEKSSNWFHLAREYTERWHHQQQIREATGKEGIMTKELFFPVMDTFFRALPHTFKNIDAPAGTVVHVSISSAIGGNWYLQKKENAWLLIAAPGLPAAASVTISPAIAWKLFSKSIRPAAVLDQISIRGDASLARHALEMVSVMA